ncbi:hypothetical protein [Mycobacterium sp. 852002-51613_SCH5001154]|uniref:hypothetical protein n=1 Tax=Mycobacterium sp. 852002-51613_SCH5001154 TaxID=1834104 RepID=UPI0012E8E134|nr:hypothetical protein [Mycobacterium sp. 852002-51613_SCH5001154]
MSADIVAIHGIRNYAKRSPDDAATRLAAAWAVELGLAPQQSDRIAAAYYAHHLRLGNQGPEDDLDALDVSLGGLPRQLLETWMAELGWESTASQGGAFAPMRQLASSFVERYGVDRPIVDRFLTAFLAEVVVYFHPTDPTPRQAVRSTVGSTISMHRPRVVIAHSLGSVASYEALWQYPELNVELLITIGSPLAFPDRIFPLLQPRPTDGRGHRPPGVRRWVNVADTADLVALPRHLDRYFNGVEQNLELSVGRFCTHSSGTYLRDARVRSLIETALGESRQPISHSDY